MLEYPKPVMRFSELVKMGVPKETINQAIAEKQAFVRKINPAKKNSAFIVFTADFDKWWRTRNKNVRPQMTGERRHK